MQDVTLKLHNLNCVRTRTLRIKSLLELTSFLENQYVKPNKTNFPAVDAIALHSGELWNSKKSYKLTILLWQMNISKVNLRSLNLSVSVLKCLF